MDVSHPFPLFISLHTSRHSGRARGAVLRRFAASTAARDGTAAAPPTPVEVRGCVDIFPSPSVSETLVFGSDMRARARCVLFCSILFSILFSSSWDCL